MVNRDFESKHQRGKDGRFRRKPKRQAKAAPVRGVVLDGRGFETTEEQTSFDVRAKLWDRFQGIPAKVGEESVQRVQQHGTYFDVALRCDFVQDFSVTLKAVQRDNEFRSDGTFGAPTNPIVWDVDVEIARDHHQARCTKKWRRDISDLFKSKEDALAHAANHIASVCHSPQTHHGWDEWSLNGKPVRPPDLQRN